MYTTAWDNIAIIYIYKYKSNYLAHLYLLDHGSTIQELEVFLEVNNHGGSKMNLPFHYKLKNKNHMVFHIVDIHKNVLSFLLNNSFKSIRNK